MKKYISLLLALILSLALCVPMLADEPAAGSTTAGKTTLTVNSSVAGYTADYEAYKLLDLTTAFICPKDDTHVCDDKCNAPCELKHTHNDKECYIYSYTVADGYLELLQGVLGINAAADGKTMDETVYDAIAAKTDAAAIRAFADAVIDAIDAANAAVAEGEAKPFAPVTFQTGNATEVDQGYWLIVDATENPTTSLENTKVIKSLVMLDTAGKPALTVTAKDKTASLTKTVGEQKLSSTSAQYGQKVPFELTSGQIPSNLAEYTKYTFEITDTMSKGLTFNEDLTVKVGTTSVSASSATTAVAATDGYFLTVETNETTGKTTIVVDLSAYLFANKATVAGQVVTVNYSATVNTDAELGTVAGNPNEAYLTFTNDPKYGYEGTTVPDEVKVYSAKITVVKVDGASKVEGDDNTISYTKKLAGAEFKLYKMDGNNKVYYKFVAADEENDTPAKVEWVAADAADVKTSDANGELEFKGLSAGTYYLEEVKAPEGYNLLAEAVPVEVKNADNAAYLANASVNVENNNGLELPSTGGIGTTIFYAVGGALMAGAVILLITKKKMSNEE